MQCLDYFKSRAVIGAFVATEDGQRLIAFFKDEFDLDMTLIPPFPRPSSGTTIDAVFIRRLAHSKSQVYVLYFSYQKPIVNV